MHGPTECQILNSSLIFVTGHIRVVFSQYVHLVICWPGSSVGIATDYGLDGPGSNPGGDEIFLPSRPVLGSTQPPLKFFY